MAEYITNNSQEALTNILAQYLRNDDLHASKNIEDANLRKLLLGLSVGFQDVNNNINILAKEGNVKEAEALIEKWEMTVGIPDDCLDNSGTLAQKRNNVLIKFAGLQGTLIQQFEYVINLLGYSGIVVKSGINAISYPLTYPILYIGSEEEAAFTIVVVLPPELSPQVYPLLYPITYDSIIPQLQCIFDKLKPANVQIIYQYEVNIVDTRLFITLENGDFLVAENGDFIVTES